MVSDDRNNFKHKEQYAVKEIVGLVGYTNRIKSLHDELEIVCKKQKDRIYELEGVLGSEIKQKWVDKLRESREENSRLKNLLDECLEEKEKYTHAISILMEENSYYKKALNLRLDEAGFKESFLKEYFVAKQKLEKVSEMEKSIEYLNEENQILKEYDKKQNEIIQQCSTQVQELRKERDDLSTQLVLKNHLLIEKEIRIESLNHRVEVQQIEIDNLMNDGGNCDDTKIRIYNEKIGNLEAEKNEIVSQYELQKKLTEEAGVKVQQAEARIKTLEKYLVKERSENNSKTQEEGVSFQTSSNRHIPTYSVMKPHIVQHKDVLPMDQNDEIGKPKTITRERIEDSSRPIEVNFDQYPISNDSNQISKKQKVSKAKHENDQTIRNDYMDMYPAVSEDDSTIRINHQPKTTKRNKLNQIRSTNKALEEEITNRHLRY